MGLMTTSDWYLHGHPVTDQHQDVGIQCIVEGMVCDACSSRTENTLVQRSDVETASVNLEAGLAEVVVDSSTSEAELVEAVESLGFAVSVA
ncbi:putative cation-transporting ATPase [Auxenochlorella protothecoides]|uniref:Putative cation-transporting ATPase n=1 Tax=Auxenochlorella protothecoides TaxID=3075 RepID=A0A087SKP1_AUXPR|nr:putative cation-transporting ATPase [Auxenochlorella protothecoides]KFM26295.1 putative cation-transporting ATPase [Auxenochlorella protothecoides]